MNAGTQVFDWMAAHSRRIDRLVQRGFDDGVQQAIEAGHPAPARPPLPSDRLLHRVRTFYQPHVLRYTRDLLRVARNGDPQATDQWIDKNQWRVVQALRGATWAGAEAGYAWTLAQAGHRISWHNDKHSDVCWLCQDFDEGGPYSWETLPDVPGGGLTPCGSNCHCWLEIDGHEFARNLAMPQ